MTKTEDPRSIKMLHLHVMHIFSPVLTPVCSDWLPNEVLWAHSPAVALLQYVCVLLAENRLSSSN